jgi:hypothetical protein
VGVAGVLGGGFDAAGARRSRSAPQHPSTLRAEHGDRVREASVPLAAQE